MNRQQSQRPQSRPYGPLQRRLLGLAGFLAVLMIALIVFHAFHTGSTGLNAVAEAAERTARQPGAKLAMEVTYTSEGSSKSVVGNGGGTYNARTGRTTASLTVPIPGKGSVTVDTVADERRVFMRSALFESELPRGKDWLEMEPLLGHSAQTAFGSGNSAKSQLEILKAVGGDTEELGEETVRGHLTTRYKGTVELAKAAQLLRDEGKSSLAEEFEKVAEQVPAPIPVEVWIDEKGLVRESRVVEPLPAQAGGTALTMDMRFQFYAFGAHPKIELPAERRTFDYTPILRAKLGLEDGSTFGPLRPPAGAKPLPAAVFDRRAVRVCREVGAKAEAFVERSKGLLARIKSLGASVTDSVEGRQAISAYGTRVMEPAYRLVRHSNRALAAIVPPPALAADYRRYLKANAKQAEWLLAQARLFELGTPKPADLKARALEAKAEERANRGVATNLGIGACERSADGSASRSEAETSA